MKKWPVERQILAGFALALALLTAMGALLYQSSQTLIATHRSAQRSQQALTALETVLALVSRAEADQRLYYFTGHDADLRTRDAALARIDRLLADLRSLMADDPTVSAQLPELEQRVAGRRRHLEWVLEGRQQGGLEEARKRISSAPGRIETQQLEEAVERLQATELARLESREQAARSDAKVTVLFVLLFLLFSTASVSVLYFRIRREIRARTGVRDALARHTDELRASETRLRAVVDTATDGIIVIDHRGIIDSFNVAAERLFGYKAADVTGKNVSMLMPSPDREQHDGYLARYLAGGEPRIIGIGREVVAQRKDGTLFPMDLAVSAMQVGSRRMFTGIVRDITYRKHGEEQRAQLIQELQSANDELTNFAYAVSHDLKAPLRAIGSLADWLHTDYGEHLDAQGQEHLRLLKSRVQRMDNLIDGILQYSRVGRVRETPIPVDTNVTINEAVHLLAPPPHIRIDVDGTLPVITAEPTRIQQLFQNLLSNAIKYMDKPEGAIRIGCRPLDGMWQFSVADNGPGIETRHHEKIFQLFQTLAPRDRVESTGVGLALVKKIVEVYGGRVWLESTPGRGSTFYFTLPRASTAARSKERSTP